VWEYFIGKPPNIYDISLLIFSAWCISYAVFLGISFTLVVIKRKPGCVWTAINCKIHICLDSVLNTRLDIEQEKNGISAILLKTHSGRIWTVGTLGLLVFAYFLILDFLGLFVELILVGLFSSIYFLYEKTLHDYSIGKNYLTGDRDLPRVLSEFLHGLGKGSSFKKS
jgi:hypothetical protein